MFDEFLRRNDVLNFISQIKSSERYYKKEIGHFEKYPFYISSELSLYIFYDALFLYKVIIDDIYFFDEYLEQLEKIYKKIDQVDKMIEGIHKLIGKMVSIKLELKEVNSKESREEILTYIYDQYISNGYFIHGFNTSYQDSILNNGFIPEEYDNYYEDYQKLNSIFAKYNISSIVEKNFSEKKVSFTDDFILGCYYSNYAPMFFSSFLENDEYFGKRNRKDGYMIDDYSLSIYGLKKYMTSNLFDMDDQKFILQLVKKQWDLLHQRDKKISLLLVKRNNIYHDEISIKEYIDDQDDIYEVVDRLLSSKFHHVFCTEAISSNDLLFISLDSYYEKEEKISVVTPEEEFYQYKEKEVNQEFLNVYGKVSIFLLLGSLLITCGVLITIYMIMKGM